ncbi:asparagine synthase-related protein [Aliiglaciecola sp. 3_MG-2023]|uniref:asparagine synthetase B family protein n=1 Tax=Aliiglaciecola sp. 3_MG-2023 TaxID=3062644 RepID=UPI0026E2A2F7|nr:asparagine synthase-related protein [Aliiglaciecola sp. 3_MG-2023]MDO6691870.1 asparagine synthase-related protein [Aliiglaciecola sp. 3_MG-2023]
MQLADWYQIADDNELELFVHHHKQTSSCTSEQRSLIVHGYILLNGVKVDPELVLDAYSSSASLSDFYEQLSGQFWLVISEKNSPVIVLTDHLATKPCFYYQRGNQLFISDSLRAIKAIDNVSLMISKQALYNYIYFHCIPAPKTVYEDVYKVEPGKAIYFGVDGVVNNELLYCPEFATHIKDPNEALKTCLNTIETAVESHSTDNVGAFLSGGLDSSTVAGMLAKIQGRKDQPEKAKTFSIGFEVPGYDETEYALITAKHFDTNHEVLYLKPEEAAKEFVKVAQYFDEPFGNSSAMAAYFCATFAKSKGIEVLLAGDGGDEFFAGNERYAKQKVFEHFTKLPTWLANSLDVLLNNGFTRKLPLFKKVASYIAQAKVALPGRLQTHNFVNQLGNDAIFSQEILDNVDVTEPAQQLKSRFHDCKSEHPVDGMLYLDWKFTLADNDLVKVNKMCELAGVEVRYPLIDKNIVDFSCTIPADVKLPGSQLRDFYKKTCKGFLPDETLNKSKHGFGLPFGVWMNENQTLKDLTITALNSFKKRNIVKQSLVEQALESHGSVHAGYFGELIWIMVVLELWLQKEAKDFRA